MSLFKPRTVLNSLWPSLVIIWAFGCARIKLKRAWRILYAIMMSVIMVYLIMYTIIYEISSKGNPIVLILSITPYLKISATLTLIWSWELKGLYAVDNAIVKLTKLDEELRNFGLIINHKKFMWKQLIIISGFLILFSLTSGLHQPALIGLFDSRILENSYTYLMITLSIHVQHLQAILADFVYTMILEGIRIRFKLVNEIFNRISESSENRINVKIFTTSQNRILDISGEQIHGCYGRRHLSSYLVMERVDRACRIHRRLLKVAQDIGDAFSLHFSVNYPLFFAHVIFQAVLIVSSFIDRQTVDMYINAVSIILMASNFWLIVVVCSNTSDEANKLGISLYKVPINNSAVHNQLQEYSIHVVQRKLRFTAGRIFDIDRKLANFIFSTLMKYVVILLQLRSNDYQ